MVDLSSQFICYLEVERQLSPHTVRAYASDIGQLKVFLAEQCGLPSSLAEQEEPWS